MEAAGVRVDAEYLKSAIAEADVGIKESEAALRADPVYKIWRRRFGEKTNIAAPRQLATIVFKELGYRSKKKTAKSGDDAADESAFEGIEEPFLKHYFTAQKLRKGRDTYLVGIQREMVCARPGEYYVHPSYNLNTVSSFRSSANDPNWQNIPVRNPKLAEAIRRSYIPRPGNQFFEIDYGQIEVRIPVCYHNDPNLRAYVSDPTKDMHRDVAMQVFKLKAEEVSKEIRHLAKNSVVFPLFYGSFYAQVAPQVWEFVDSRGLKLQGSEKSLRDHLTEVGFRELGSCNGEDRPRPGTFESHIKDVEDDFWGKRFKVYAQWKKDWYVDYLQNGGFRMLTGFAVNAVLDRKQVCNTPIQGVAFHCLLWSLIQLVKLLKRYKFKTVIVGQIHDCIVLDGPPSERNTVIDLCHRVMTEDIHKAFKWLNVPLTAEPECCPVGRSWYDKAALKKDGDFWVPADISKWEKRYGAWA